MKIFEICLPFSAQSREQRTSNFFAAQTLIKSLRGGLGANPTPNMAEKPPYRDQMEPVCTKTCILILSYPFLYIISHTSGGRFCSQKVFHKKLFEIFHKTMRWSEVVFFVLEFEVFKERSCIVKEKAILKKDCHYNLYFLT